MLGEQMLLIDCFSIDIIGHQSAYSLYCGVDSTVLAAQLLQVTIDKLGDCYAMCSGIAFDEIEVFFWQTDCQFTLWHRNTLVWL